MVITAMLWVVKSPYQSKPVKVEFRNKSRPIIKKLDQKLLKIFCNETLHVCKSPLQWQHLSSSSVYTCFGTLSLVCQNVKKRKDDHKNLPNHEFIKVITELDLVFIKSDVIFYIQFKIGSRETTIVYVVVLHEKLNCHASFATGNRKITVFCYFG